MIAENNCTKALKNFTLFATIIIRYCKLNYSKNRIEKGISVEELKQEPVTVFLVLINVLVFLAIEITGGSDDTMHMLQCGAGYAPAIMSGEYFRIFTSMFLHFGVKHLGNNMLVLFVLGGRMERTVGRIRYLLIYLLGGMGGNILSLFAELKSGEFAVSAGASGAVFAVMGAMIYAVLRGKGHVEDLSTKQVLLMAAFSLYFGFTSEGVDNAAHVGGLICGFILAVIVYHPKKYGTQNHVREYL